jgi:hypothetical protein
VGGLSGPEHLGALGGFDPERASSPSVVLIPESQFGIGDSVVASRRREDVEVGVRPAHGGLDDLVQPVEADVRRDDQAAPDQRLEHAAQVSLSCIACPDPPARFELTPGSGRLTTL